MQIHYFDAMFLAKVFHQARGIRMYTSAPCRRIKMENGIEDSRFRGDVLLQLPQRPSLFEFIIVCEPARKNDPLTKGIGIQG